MKGKAENTDGQKKPRRLSQLEELLGIHPKTGMPPLPKPRRQRQEPLSLGDQYLRDSKHPDWSTDR